MMPATVQQVAPAAGLFDRSGRLPAPPLRDLAAEGVALLCDRRRFRGRLPLLSSLPRGDGHTVLVLPPLFGSDRMTGGFRAWLAALGYRAEAWGAGINLGPTHAAWRQASERLPAVAACSGRPVSLVGYSLGGVLARALARQYPVLVRRVITVCSPFRLPTATRLEPLYRLMARWHIDEAFQLALVAEPPPAPTTAIYTTRDGVVAWRSCLDLPAPGRENIAIDGAHSTMLANPQAIRIIAEHLARP
ncbi:MAG TPA: alpha/beta hydrolase [Stellaceae bacterium]|jgi:pimeloyl-ACP methyl ester carboxylesterase|nr:alpha/beta hydrolase [Stellaceae bacterium]